MDNFKRELEKMGQEVSASIDELRREMRAQYQEVGEDVSAVGRSVENLRESVENVRQSVQTLGETVRTLGESVQTLGESVRTSRESVETLGESVQSLQRGLARQGHALDQGLAQTNDVLQHHRENIGTIVLTYVEDLNAVKSDVRALTERVERLERPPAA